MRFIAVLLGCACIGSGAVSKDAPSWVLEERRVSVDNVGLVTTRTRKAIKILTHEGQGEAEANISYLRGGRRVKTLHAWLIAPSGFVKTYEKSSIADMGSFDAMELYNDV